MALTPSQAAAVECDQNLIIFAGPGSGKTSTSVQKAVRVLLNPQRRLILCTFTVEAARELENRLRVSYARTGDYFPAERVRVGTFDSLALWHLKQCGGMKGTLLSPKAQGPRVRHIIKELGLGSSDELMPWFEKYQSTTNRAALLRDIEKHCRPAQELIEEYYKWLKSGDLMDLATVKRTCAEGMEVGRIPLLPCTDLLVDEAQDSDELQMLMARTHGRNGITTTLVGDDDQTIYDFRNAIGYSGMTAFMKECNAEIVRLGENFRSHAEIVHAGVNLIEFNNPNRIDKKQFAVKGPGGFVEAVSMESLELECAWMAESIQSNFSKTMECAVIARKNKALDLAESALSAKGIPHHRNGPSIWDRAENSAYLSLLDFLVNGTAGISTALGYLGMSLNIINAAAAACRSERSREPDVAAVFNSLDAKGPQAAILKSMCTNVARWRASLRAGEVSLVIGQTEEEFLRWIKMDNGKQELGESPRVRRAREGIAHASNALKKMESASLSARLTRLLASKSKDAADGVVRLMTMHASKGLEFDTVYIIDCAQREADSTLTEGPSERRVLYVGMTRAKRRLHITYSGPMPLFLLEAGFRVPEIMSEDTFAKA